MDNLPGVREVLDEREAELVEQSLALLDDRDGEHSLDGARHVREGIFRLATLWRAIEVFPHTRRCQKLGNRSRDFRTLLETFATVEPYSIEAYLPTRATLARAYAMAKFNFTRMLHYVLADSVSDGAKGRALLAVADSVERSAVAAIIAEDVLRSLASDTRQPESIRRRVAAILSHLWDQRATQSLADFAPLLDSAWRAKARVRISYGTLAGVHELFQLIRNGCDPAFVDFFGGDDTSVEQYAAFEEFVFNSTYEELAKMRSYMAEHHQAAIDAEDVAHIFGVTLDRVHATTGSPQDMFFTFREREMWARQRRIRDDPGPKRTAEEYVMVTVLSKLEDEFADCGCGCEEEDAEEAPTS